MQTTELVAGRELDALVAEKVMGLKPFHGWEYPDHIRPSQPILMDGPGGTEIPHYSTEIAAAWQVLDAMVWRVGTANIRLDMEDYGRGFLNDAGAERVVWVTIGEHTACGPAPLAICRAALAALAT